MYAKVGDLNICYEVAGNGHRFIWKRRDELLEDLLGFLGMIAPFVADTATAMPGPGAIR